MSDLSKQERCNVCCVSAHEPRSRTSLLQRSWFTYFNQKSFALPQ